MSAQPQALVLGSTGNTGSHVARLLRQAGVAVRAASRTPQGPDGVRFDWTEPDSHPVALGDADRLYLVAPIGVAQPGELVRPFLELAAARGVRRVVLLSSSAVEPGDTGLGRLDQLTRAMFPEWTVLRPSWFMQNLTGSHAVADGIRSSGRITTATGSGRRPSSMPGTSPPSPPPRSPSRRRTARASS